MNLLRRQPGDAGVLILRVTPLEEWLAEQAGVFDASKSVGELGLALYGLELALAVRIVIRDMGRLCDLTTPRSAIFKVEVFDVIGAPLSAWVVSCPGGTFCW